MTSFPHPACNWLPETRESSGEPVQRICNSVLWHRQGPRSRHSRGPGDALAAVSAGDRETSSHQFNSHTMRMWERPAVHCRHGKSQEWPSWKWAPFQCSHLSRNLRWLLCYIHIDFAVFLTINREGAFLPPLSMLFILPRQGLLHAVSFSGKIQ